jgi:hypothetical protein
MGMAALLVCGGSAHAAEVVSNGAGGGAWTDPATWTGKKVPGADDDVVIRKNDVVVFDRAGDGKATCRKLQIDPRGGLTFKTGSGKLSLAVDGGIESFGAIRLDGTKSANDDFEVRLLGETAEKRLVKLGRGGALLLYGRANLPDGKRNVALISPPDKEPVLGQVDADGTVMIDWQRARIEDVKLSAKAIDNTGSKPNERIKLVDNIFTGPARIYTYTCDTPEVLRNSFDNSKGKPIAEPAIHMHSCPLAQVKDNTVRGDFAIGIGIYVAVDAVLGNNTIEKCGIGLNGGYGVPNVMIQHLSVRGCATGVKLEGATGVLEDVTVEGATTAFSHTNSRLQLTNFRIKDLAKKGVAVEFDVGTLALLNCELRPEDIKIPPQKPPEKPPPALVTSQQYFVIAAKKAPAGAVVEVRTVAPAPTAGVTDPNVRNSPAALVDGLTPLPKDLTPLVIKAWSIDIAGKPQPAPEYTIKLLGPAAKEGADRPVLATQNFRPQPGAIRAEPNDKMPTLEVLLK